MVERARRWFRNLPIRYKLLVTYSAVLTAFVTLGGAVAYSLVRDTIEQNIESELTNSTAAILSLVETSAAASIRNHLRAVADRNLEIVESFHGQYRRGELTEAEAKARAGEVILCQHIGSTGYVCCLDSAGVVVIHPKQELLAADLSAYGFVQELKARRQGYLEYDWQNPGDPVARPKAMYMTFFAPWDWIIIVSSYRDEFTELVNVEDFRESVLALRFGQTGYAYVADREGNAVIHPKFQGSNIFRQRAVPSEFFDEMLHQKSGTVRYSWQNPGEDEARQKLVIYNQIPEYGWIVASSSYLDEVYAPLRTVRRLFVLTVACSLLLILPITLRVSATITNPLQRLTARFARGEAAPPAADGPSDEVGRLAACFEGFLARLEASHESLTAEVAERRQAEAALRESEDRYRSVMEAAPDPIAVYDMEGRLQYVNPAFARVFGWELAEWRGRRLDHFVPAECWPETRAGIERILSGQTISGVRTRRTTRDGRTIHVSISGATYRDREGELGGSVMILRDVTEQVRAEDALRLSEEMFSKAFRSSPNGISILTLKDRRFLNVNETFLGLTGYAREEVLERSPQELGLLVGVREGRQLLRELRRQGQLRGGEVEFRTKAGARRLGRVSADVLEIWGEPCMLATLEDVTERRALEREVIETGDRERRRIGQELHDDLGPHLIGIEVLSKVLERKLDGASRGEAEHARRIRGLIAEAIQKSRALGRGLCPVHLDENGLEFALRELAESTRSIYGVGCQFQGGGGARVGDNSVATQLFYIAREAVHNAVKHAQARQIRVELAAREGKLHLRVDDDGRGLPEAGGGGGGMGLRIMGYRAHMIGGALAVRSVPGEGTSVSVVLAGGGRGEAT